MVILLRAAPAQPAAVGDVQPGAAVPARLRTTDRAPVLLQRDRRVAGTRPRRHTRGVRAFRGRRRSAAAAGRPLDAAVGPVSACAVSYDFIGRYESLWADSARHVSAMDQQSNRRCAVTTGSFTDVRPGYMKRLRELYARDYEYFGYTAYQLAFT